MKQTLSVIILAFAFFLSGIGFINAETMIVPLSQSGAWSYNSQPNAVYSNGKTYFAWINNSKAIVAAVYNHADGSYQERVITSGYSASDLSSPGILIRKSGQILIFASKNQGENNFQCYRSTSTTGDLSEGFSSQDLVGYGISSTIPYAIGDDIVVFWRSKNNLGYSLIKNGNEAGKTGALAGPTPRTGFLGDGGFGNNYAWRMEVPQMRTHQDENGDIHMVITQLGTGLKFSNSTIHYLKIKNNPNENGLLFYKADDSAAGSITFANPPDVVYATTQATDKAWAYDITLDTDGNPVILYDAFNGNNVNAASNPGETSGHTYKRAKWNGTAWENSTVVVAEAGLPTAQYTASYTFLANSYMAGGMAFVNNKADAVYLSKKPTSGSFEIFKYTTNDEGATWQETEAVTTGTPEGTVNIRPITPLNAPTDSPLDLLWMNGTYTSPTTYETQILVRGIAGEATGIAFEHDQYEIVIGEEKALNVVFAPLFVANKQFTLSSSDPATVEITAEGKIRSLKAGSVTITATAASNSALTATCEVNVINQAVFEVFKERIIADIRADKISTITKLDENVASYLSSVQTNGSFPDVNYGSTVRTDWPPMVHLNRQLEMGLAYTHPESSYFEDANLKEKLDAMLTYWQDKKPYSTNWYQNEIGEPHRMGAYLIVMQELAKEPIPAALMTTSINRMRDKGGDPGKQTGANRVDVAFHWMYRACLTNDGVLLQEAMDYIYAPVVYTNGAEGIQYDNSFTQHGRQLHIGQYGDVFLEGVSKSTLYGVGTPYAIPEERRAILSSVIKDTYISTHRGSYIFFSGIGRASTRPNNIKRTDSRVIERMITIDPENAQIYEDALARLRGEQAANYNISPKSTHFFKTDYTIHQRPKYSMDLRMVSTRTARNEILSDNGEGLKQYFMSDGATGIFLDGDEYYNIFPVWNWAKIPGTTTPEFTTIPRATSYIRTGESGVVGGVSDSLYNVTVYKYKDTFSGINSSANKAYFFFDDEVVCMGNSIKSTSEYKINTTVNQTLQKGDVTVSSEGNETTFTTGNHQYNDNLNWALHGKVGYFFPRKGKIDLSAQEQSGSWLDINTGYPEEGTVTKDVFSLSFDHGLSPTDEKYEYIIVPGLESAAEAHAYKVNNIDVIVNSDSIQAVYHKDLNIFGIVFYKACGFKKHGLTIEADDACAIIVKDIDKAELVVHIADLKKSTSKINIGIETEQVTPRRKIEYNVTSSNILGSSVKYKVNNETPLFEGRDELYDRSDWTITTSIEGPADGAVGGTDPYYMIDGDNVTSFLFVKPGKSLGTVIAPSNYIPSFTIDMQKEQELSFFVYRHRTYNNTNAVIRASKVSFYGKNNQNDEFTLVMHNAPIATDIDEVKVQLPQKVSYRYVMVVLEEWNTSSGNTIQISEFNLGNNVLTEIAEMEDDWTGLESAKSDNATQLILYPNVVQRGDRINIRSSALFDNAEVQVFDLAGKAVYRSNDLIIETSRLNSGYYILEAKSTFTGERATAKFVVQ